MLGLARSVLVRAHVSPCAEASALELIVISLGELKEKYTASGGPCLARFERVGSVERDGVFQKGVSGVQCCYVDKLHCLFLSKYSILIMNNLTQDSINYVVLLIC